MRKASTYIVLALSGLLAASPAMAQSSGAGNAAGGTTGTNSMGGATDANGETATTSGGAMTNQNAMDAQSNSVGLSGGVKKPPMSNKASGGG